MIKQLHVQDSKDHSNRCKNLLDGSRSRLVLIARETLKILETGLYQCGDDFVSIAQMVQEDIDGVVSIPPEFELPTPSILPSHDVVTTQVQNTLTLTAAKDMVASGKRPLVLNFANGTHVGGGFLRGAKAQEETLCYVSSLFCSLIDHPFYEYNAKISNNKSSDYSILSRATVFRNESYQLIEQPWHMDVLTCAAPIARLDWSGVSIDEGAEIMDQRIARVLDIAIAYGFTDLVLGAWGCGAFGNDPQRIAQLFAKHLSERSQYFDSVVFAIADWSEDRRFLQPFSVHFSTVESSI